MPEARATPRGGIEVVRISGALGAEVRCGDVRALGEEAFAGVYQATLDHLVIRIRGQALTDPELIAFGARFGALDFAPLAKTGKERARPHPEIIVVSNVVENGVPIGVLRDAEVVWHSDNSYRETPLSYSLLYAFEVPPAGGETGFVNMYLALETLPPTLRRAIEGRAIKHDMTYNSAGDLRAGFSPVDDVRQAPGPLHPVVRTHPETGCDALYLGRRPNAYVDGMPVDESEALLDALWSHATQAAFQWHHEWRVGEILIWDNRCVMHHRNPFDGGQRRVMHRVQCAGERPTHNPGAAKAGHARAAGAAV